jgi:hypothetical protein
VYFTLVSSMVYYKENVARNLNYLKINQPNLRAHTYGALKDQLVTDNFKEGVEGIRGGARSFFLQIMLEVPDI